jgi:hypothetical protein
MLFSSLCLRHMPSHFPTEAHCIISHFQTAFIKGCFTHNGALANHDTVHELMGKNLSAVILKLDFEKAYDRVSWSSLQS